MEFWREMAFSISVESISRSTAKSALRLSGMSEVEDVLVAASVGVIAVEDDDDDDDDDEEEEEEEEHDDDTEKMGAGGDEEDSQSTGASTLPFDASASHFASRSVIFESNTEAVVSLEEEAPVMPCLERVCFLEAWSS